MSRFAIDTFCIYNDGGTEVKLRALPSASHRLSQRTIAADTGYTYDEARFTLDSDDEFNAQCLALESLIDNISLLTGLCVVQDATFPSLPEYGLRLHGQSLSRCGTAGRGASGTHAQITAAKSHIFITQISASPNNPATATVRAINLSADGADDPSAVVYNASLPSSPTVNEAFKLGPISVGGNALTANEITSLTIDTGINFEVVRDQVTGYATDLILRKAQPVVRIGIDSGNVLAEATPSTGFIPHGGLACTHANTTIGLIAMNAAGATSALTASEHIEITCAGRAFIEDNLSGGGEATAGSTIRIETIESSGVPLIPTTDTNLA